tara:strand:+ start:278 stop:571 length:294 start_codon:yes stop_codon:yes gene_type:complete
MTKIQINDVVRDMTAEEQAEFDARQVTPLSALEQSLSDLRQKRNKLLQECDWIELNNAPLTSSKKTEWQTYRTKLRDLTNGLDTVDKVKAVTWPTKP